MTYEKHNIHECDRCARIVGRNKLRQIPFIYMDKNDKAHPDISPPGAEPGYRQYFVCDECWKLEEKIRHNKRIEELRKTFRVIE